MSDVVVGEIAEPVDLLVVGGGPGGYAAAIRAGQLGRSVTLVERDGADGIGGVCLNVGCIPSKALIDTAEAAYRAGQTQAGLSFTGAFDMDRWQKWCGETVTDLRRGVQSLLDAQRVEVIAGHFRFAGPSRGVLETPRGSVRFLEFTHAVIATGSQPLSVPGLARDGHGVLDTTDLLRRKVLPKSLLVAGVDSFGLELAIALAKLGVGVSLVEAGSRVLPGLTAALGRPVGIRLRQLGVRTLTQSTVTGFADGRAEIVTPTGTEVLAVEAVLVSPGRAPNTADLGLDALGVTPGPDGHVDVSGDRRATQRVAAIGDVTSGPAFAHKAYAEAHVAAEALSGRSVTFHPQAIPVVVFSDPEVASAGLSAEDAEAVGMEVVVSDFPLSALGRARIGGDRVGRLLLVWERDSGTVVGAHAVGRSASELIGEGVLAIEMGATVEDVAATIHPHPTLVEQFAEAARVGRGEPLHVALGEKVARSHGRATSDPHERAVG